MHVFPYPEWTSLLNQSKSEAPVQIMKVDGGVDV
jgi:hypothetical protein